MAVTAISVPAVIFNPVGAGLTRGYTLHLPWGVTGESLTNSSILAAEVAPQAYKETLYNYILNYILTRLPIYHGSRLAVGESHDELRTKQNIRPSFSRDGAAGLARNTI